MVEANIPVEKELPPEEEAAVDEAPVKAEE
jgi:hypothetical protein